VAERLMNLPDRGLAPVREERQHMRLGLRHPEVRGLLEHYSDGVCSAMNGRHDAKRHGAGTP
jgi:hypothetical protein